MWPPTKEHNAEKTLPVAAIRRHELWLTAKPLWWMWWKPNNNCLWRLIENGTRCSCFLWKLWNSAREKINKRADISGFNLLTIAVVTVHHTHTPLPSLLSKSVALYVSADLNAFLSTRVRPLTPWSTQGWFNRKI